MQVEGYHLFETALFSIPSLRQISIKLQKNDGEI
jgi:hypothetical protein